MRSIRFEDKNDVISKIMTNPRINKINKTLEKEMESSYTFFC